MRNLKRFLAMALTVLMVVGSFSAMSVSAFDDVDEYQEAIDVMAALGIVCGEDETTFNPDESVLRWHMALWITKMMTGKVDSAYVEANFNTALNSTVYTDLNEGQYMGATAYAANNGIVIGTSATTFEPEAEIMIQDVFTMVVRMLGYGSTAMNANYPWSFIDKAISLDLDAGLPADYANEKAATRGETAQILYNALTAVKADGSTLGYDFFGLEKATVIITGTKDGNMFNSKAAVVTKTVDEVDQVAFAVLNADGTIGAETYYAPKTAFGIEGNANAYVGYPFVVRTNDAYASFLTVDPIEAVALDQDAVVGAAASASAAAKKVVTIDETAYTLVDTYSDFIKDNSTEIILNAVGTIANTIDYGSYVMDEDLNIMGKDGSVLLYWVTTQGFGNDIAYANLNGTYLYKIPGTDKYIVPNDAIWAQAATYVADAGTTNGFKAIKDSYAEIEKFDAYSDTVVFDIDGDGDYDRGIYTQYSFAKMTNNSSGYLLANGTRVETADVKTAAMTIVNTDGEAVDVIGKYVLYAYNPLYKTVIVKAVYETSTGLVTGADLVANKITFNGFGLDFFAPVVGDSKTIGNAKLAGSISASKGNYFTEVIGKNVVYVEDNGAVIAIENYADSAAYMVVTNTDLGGYTTMGYKQIIGYTSTAAVKEIISVNAVNNYWYATPSFTEGTLIALYKDALGYYDVKAKDYNYTAAADAEIVIKNGIVSADGIASFPTFAATADLVWIVNNGNGKYETYIGIPANGAIVEADNAKIFYEGKFIYVNGGKFGADFADYTNNNPWGNAPVQSGIVYLDNAAIATRVETNVIGNANIFGTVSTYSKAIDMINGGYVSVTYTDYNYERLTAGFYQVEGGRIIGKADALVETALLAAADKTAPNFKYTWVADYNAGTTYYTDNLATVNNVLPTLYTASNGTVVLKDGKPADELTVKGTLYKALNDDTANGDDAIVVYYAKAMYADSKPLFLALDTTVKTLNAKPAAPVLVPMTVKFIDLDNDAVAGKIDLYKAASVSAANDEIRGWVGATTAVATVEIADVKVGDSYIFALDNDYAVETITAKYYANDLYEVGGNDYTTDAAFVQLPTANKAYNYFKFVITEDMIVDGKVEYVVSASENYTAIDPNKSIVDAIKELTGITEDKLAALEAVIEEGNNITAKKLNAIVAAIKAGDAATAEELAHIVGIIANSRDAIANALADIYAVIGEGNTSNAEWFETIANAIATKDAETAAMIAGLVEAIADVAELNAEAVADLVELIAATEDANVAAIAELVKAIADVKDLNATAITALVEAMTNANAENAAAIAGLVTAIADVAVQNTLTAEAVEKLAAALSDADANLVAKVDELVDFITGLLSDENLDAVKNWIQNDLVGAIIADDDFTANELDGLIGKLNEILGAVEEKTYTVKFYAADKALDGLFTAPNGVAINVLGSEETATLEDVTETAYAITLDAAYEIIANPSNSGCSGVYFSVIVPYVGGTASNSIFGMHAPELDVENTYGVGLPIIDGIDEIIDVLEAFADENGVITIVVDVCEDATMYKEVTVNVENEEGCEVWYWVDAANNGAFVEPIKVLVPSEGRRIDVSADADTVKMSVTGADYEEWSVGDDDGVAIFLEYTDDVVTVTVEKAYAAKINVNIPSKNPVYVDVFKDVNDVALEETVDADGIITIDCGSYVAEELSDAKYTVVITIARNLDVPTFTVNDVVLTEDDYIVSDEMTSVQFVVGIDSTDGITDVVVTRP